jgi:acyl-homoserine lactone acylase PvdQ
LGSAHTVKTHDGWDADEFPLAKDGYRFNGKIRSFDREEKVLKVKEKNGDLRSESLVVRRSVRGSILTFWKKAMDADRLFAKPWSEDAPLTTPDGLANPAEAVRVLEATATKVEVTYGALDLAWGEVFQLPGVANLQANGADGALGLYSGFAIAASAHWRTWRIVYCWRRVSAGVF